MRLILFITLLTILKGSFCFSQPRLLPDSIEVKINEVKEDTHIKLLIRDAIYYVYNHPPLAYELSRRIGGICRKNDWKIHESKSHDIMGVYFQNKGIYDSARYHYWSSLDIRKNIGQQKLVSQSYNNLGVLFRRQALYDSSLYYYYAALKIANEINDSLLQGNYYNNIGLTWYNKAKYDSSIANHLKSLAFRTGLNDLKGISGSLNNLGIVYEQLGDYEQALKYLNTSLEIKRTLGNKRILASAYLNLGNTYYQLSFLDSAENYFHLALNEYQKLEDQKNVSAIYHDLSVMYLNKNNYQTASRYNNLALTIRRTLGNKEDLITSLVQQSHILKCLGKHKEALSNAKHAYTLAVTTSSIEYLKITTKALSEIYEETNQTDSALQYFKLSMAYQDSILNLEKIQYITEMKEKYESLEKDKHISALYNENRLNEVLLEKQLVQRNLYLAGLILLLLILSFIVYIYKIKIKSKELVSKELKETQKMRSKFFANVTHEFRTPLTLIIGPLSDLIERWQGSDRKILTLARQNALKLQRLIDQLLSLSKLEVGKLYTKAKDQVLSDFIPPLVMSFSSLAENKKIAYHYQLNHLETNGLVDSEKVEIILYNLLSNAFKFTSPGGKISVEVKFDESRSCLFISVQDNGIGIKKEDHSRIFERFYQAKHGSNQLGTGIGLSLTRELVNLMKGTINLESEPGMGSIFEVQLPLKKLPSSKFRNKKTYSNEIIAEDNHDINELEPLLLVEKPVLLIVEDHDELRKYIKYALGNSYDYLEADNGTSGFDLAKDHLPDLMISDLMMPGINGFELCEKIKGDEMTNHIPFIMLTARVERDDKIEGLEAGAIDYIIKPFDSRELQFKVRNVMQKVKNAHAYLKNQLINEPAVTGIFSSDDVFMSRLNNRISDHLNNENFTVELLAEEMNLSRVQLYRKVKSIAGLSASDLIRIYRLKLAWSILIKKGATVSEVAYKVGFQNLSYFSKSFREHFGILPNELLKGH